MTDTVKASALAKSIAEQSFMQYAEPKIKEKLHALAVSYANKGEIDDRTWMIGEIMKYGISEEKATSMSDEILTTINSFASNMAEIEKFCASGRNKTKETWLSLFIDKNVLAEQKAEYLTQVDAALIVGNQIADKINVNGIFTVPEVFADIHKLTAAASDEIPVAESISEVKNQIIQQPNLIAASTLSESAVMTEEIMPIEGIEELDDSSMKMLSSLATSISAVTDKIPFLEVLPISAITNLACFGVESVKNLVDLARGKIKSPVEALEKTGKAAVSAMAGFIKSGLPAAVFMPIPVIGPKLTFVAGTYLRCLSKEKIKETIYLGAKKVRSTAKAAVNKAKNAIKNAAKTINKIPGNVVNFVAEGISNLFSL